MKNILIISVLLLNSLAHASSENISVLTGLHKDIVIGAMDGIPMSINIAFPEKNTLKPRPVLILIHGGGFISGDKSSKNKQIKTFAKRGFVAASAMYRLAPDYQFPAAIEDIKLAIRFLKANEYRSRTHYRQWLFGG